MRWVLILMLAVLAAPMARAQEPRITMELSAPETVVGQPLALRVKILVPTWMLKPAVFPSFEVPSLMVRLPEKSTTPTTERIEGENWAGVRRTYRFYPLAVGTYRIPPQEIILTYADPETQAPLDAAVPSPEIRFDAIVPAAARGLDPLIVAQSFGLEQSIEGNEVIAPGDAVVREVRATIDGTTAVMIPPLVGEVTDEGLRAYPAEPSISETEQRGEISGTRDERVTYVAQGPGELHLPPIRLDWFNLETGEVATAELPGFDIAVEGSLPAAPADRKSQLLTGLVVLAAIFALGLIWWRFRPRILALWDRLVADWRTSEFRADREVRRAIRLQDLSATYRALRDWSAHHPGIEARAADLASALADVGRAGYGREPSNGNAASAWKRVHAAYRRLRTGANSRQGRLTGDQLPPLNPFDPPAL